MLQKELEAEGGSRTPVLLAQEMGGKRGRAQIVIDADPSAIGSIGYPSRSREKEGRTGVVCSNCGTENQPGVKFCLRCGTRLAVACASCGAPSVPGALFCGECGTPVAAAPAQPASAIGARPAPAARFAPTSSAPAPVAERRLVSVLFGDLVGFTTLAEGRDSEEVRELLTRYFDLATVITRYGGVVEKFIGDAVMAVWGTPVAREDDAERSVRAALELVDSIRILGPGIRARAGVLTA
ncbi:MAG: zinc ribbon domain-containing protein [Chloroflexi bacterium]|nr:zinc ribbon domain-containing protein [Chloroflexota bacterium]